MLTTRQKDGITILALPRKVIGESVSEVQQVLIKQIDARPSPRILIDLRRVHKMDSSGLGTLINAYKLARAKQGRIGVINVGQNLNNLIVRSRLIHLFEHFESEAAAVSQLSPYYYIEGVK